MRAINLIPPEERQKGIFGYLRRDIFISLPLAIFAVFLFFVFTITFSQKLSVTRYEREAMNNLSQVEQIRSRSAQVMRRYDALQEENRKLLGDVRRVEDKLDILKYRGVDRVEWSGILVSLAEMAGENLWFDRVSLERGRIVIQGTTTSNMSVSSFMENLDNVYVFKDTGFTYTQKTKIDDVNLIEFEVVTGM